MDARDLKNFFISRNEGLLRIFLGIIHLPIIGRVYDYFYFNMIRRKYAKSRLSLVIEPHNICNLECGMCPYARMKRPKEEMSLELFQSIVDQAISLDCQEFQLSHYNEPLADKLIFQRLKYLNSRKANVILYSNGTLLTDKSIDSLLESPPEVIRLSVDGCSSKTYESIRKGALYESTVQGIINLIAARERKKSERPRIEVYFVMLEKNRHEIPEFKKFWQNKCDYVSFCPADSRNSTGDSLIDYAGGRLKSYPCFNPKNIFVLSNGEIGLCCMDIEGEMNLGNLNDKTLDDIMNSERLLQIWSAQFNRKCPLPLCEKCSNRYVNSAFSWWDA